jgi:colicin import membrane protein
MIISACCHVIMFLAFLFLSGTGRAREVYKPHYQVRLVGAQQAASLAPAAKAAKPAPAPQPPKPKPEAKKVVVPDKKPPPPQEKKVERPPIEKKPPEQKAPQQKAPEEKAKPAAKPAPAAAEKKEPSPEEVLAEALARIEKRAGSKGNAAAGSGPGRSVSAWEERQKEIEYSAYYDQVERAVRSNWIPPQHMDFQRQTAMTVVSITLLPDGRVLKSIVEQSSGDPQFDQSVMRAILKSTPFPPPPIGGIKQQNFELGLRFHSTPQRP